MSVAKLREGTCRGCGAPIYWCAVPSPKDEGAGRRYKWMPLDRLPQIVVEPPTAEEGPTGLGRMVTGYRSHFATCPHAGSFRRRARNVDGDQAKA